MDRCRFLEISAFSIVFSGCGGGSDSASIVAPEPIPPVSSTVAESEWQQLTADLSGKLTLPNEGSVYEKARLVFNTRFDHIYPEAIVHCANEADIITALSFIQRNNLHVTSRCGSHGYTGNSTTTGIVLDLTSLNTITLSNGTVTIGGGARLVDVYDQLTAQGVAIPLGSCLSVGISGLTLGGGIGVVDRAYGLTCDNLLSAEVITADGTKVTCSASQEPELFWLYAVAVAEILLLLVILLLKHTPLKILQYSKPVTHLMISKQLWRNGKHYRTNGLTKCGHKSYPTG